MKFMKDMVKYRIDVKSGKGHSSFIKVFNNDKHFDNWYNMFSYKIVGHKKIDTYEKI
jgi:hypothetical protein